MTSLSSRNVLCGCGTIDKIWFVVKLLERLSSVVPLAHQKRLSSVHRHGDLLLSQTTQCTTGNELLAQLWVKPRTFEIVKARWEVNRSEDEDLPTISEIPFLEGIVAYFGCGKSVSQALGSYPPVATELFLENVRALIQAESYLIDERGFPSLDAYVDYWKEFYIGSCRYYSNLEAVKRSWAEYVSGRKPGTNLFNRFKTLALDRCNDGLLLRASMADSFHEMALSVRLDPAGETVREATGAIIRAPDRVCPEAATFVHRLKEINLPAAERNELASLLGEGEGCVHLIELAFESAALLRDARFKVKLKN